MMNQDDEHLRLLSLFHYILGGLTAIFSCFPLLHLAIGIAMVTGAFPAAQNGEGPPAFVGWFFIGIASLIIVLGWSYSIGLIIAGRRLKQRQSYVYCMVMAALCCPNIPFGTCLGVCTIIVLARPSVKSLFERQKARVSDFDFV